MHFTELDKLVDARAGFGRLELVEMLLVLESGPAGRFVLMEKLGLAEASVKTMMRRLMKSGFAEKSSKGLVMSKRGISLVHELKRIIEGPVEVDAKELKLEGKSSAILVKGGADRVGDGQALRDEAIKIGAYGAVSIVCKDKLFVPFCEGVKLGGLDGRLRCLFSIEEGDVVIVASGKDLRKANQGVLGVSLFLLEN